MQPFWVAAPAMTIAVNASTNPPSLLCKLSGAIPIGYGRGIMARLILGWCELAPWLVHHREVCPSLGVTLRLRTYTTNQNAARPRERERSVSDPVCRDRRETPRELPLNSGEGRPSSRRGGRRHASDPGSVLFRARDTHAGQGRKQSEWSRRQGGERGTPLCGHIERCAASRLESKAAHDQEADKGGK